MRTNHLPNNFSKNHVGILLSADTYKGNRSEQFTEGQREERSMNGNDFERMAREYLTPLYSYCLSLTCDPRRAEELAQETLVRAYRAHPSLKDPSRFYPWLRGIAQRCTWTWWRSMKRNPVISCANPENEAAVEAVQDCQPNPAERLIAAERNQAVLKALKRLPKGRREVVILRYFEELSYADIAMRLGLTIDAVDQRLTRAKLKLRSLLHPMEVEL